MISAFRRGAKAGIWYNTRMKGKQTMYNCKKVVALILAVAVKCAFALTNVCEQISADSLLGYTLGQKYTFEDFHFEAQ